MRDTNASGAHARRDTVDDQAQKICRAVLDGDITDQHGRELLADLVLRHNLGRAGWHFSQWDSTSAIIYPGMEQLAHLRRTSPQFLSDVRDQVSHSILEKIMRPVDAGGYCFERGSTASLRGWVWNLGVRVKPTAERTVVRAYAARYSTPTDPTSLPVLPRTADTGGDDTAHTLHSALEHTRVCLARTGQGGQLIHVQSKTARMHYGLPDLLRPQAAERQKITDKVTAENIALAPQMALRRRQLRSRARLTRTPLKLDPVHAILDSLFDTWTDSDLARMESLPSDASITLVTSALTPYRRPSAADTRLMGRHLERTFDMEGSLAAEAVTGWVAAECGDLLDTAAWGRTRILDVIHQTKRMGYTDLCDELNKLMDTQCGAVGMFMRTLNTEFAPQLGTQAA